MQKANEFLTDLLISIFSKIPGSLDTIDSVENMEDELKKHKLLRQDLNNLVTSLMPYIPYLEFLRGGIAVGKYISNRMIKTENISTNFVGDNLNVVAKET